MFRGLARGVDVIGVVRLAEVDCGELNDHKSGGWLRRDPWLVGVSIGLRTGPVVLTDGGLLNESAMLLCILLTLAGCRPWMERRSSRLSASLTELLSLVFICQGRESGKKKRALENWLQN